MILAFFLLSLFFAPPITSEEQTAPPTTTSPTDDSSFWSRLFGRWAPPGSTASPSPAETSNTPTESTTDTAADAAKEGADPNRSLLEQTVSDINQSPDAHADPNTIFGLFEALSQMVDVTPEGELTVKTPTSEMLEKIKPYTDSFVDTSPLITMLKGYESFSKAKDTVGDVVELFDR